MGDNNSKPNTVVVLPQIDDQAFSNIFTAWLGTHLSTINAPGASLVTYDPKNVMFPWDHHAIEALGENSTIVIICTDPRTQYQKLSEAFDALEQRGCLRVQLIEFKIEINVDLQFDRRVEVL